MSKIVGGLAGFVARGCHAKNCLDFPKEALLSEVPPIYNHVVQIEIQYLCFEVRANYLQILFLKML